MAPRRSPRHALLGDPRCSCSTRRARPGSRGSRRRPCSPWPSPATPSSPSGWAWRTSRCAGSAQARSRRSRRSTRRRVRGCPWRTWPTAAAGCHGARIDSPPNGRAPKRRGGCRPGAAPPPPRAAGRGPPRGGAGPPRPRGPGGRGAGPRRGGGGPRLRRAERELAASVTEVQAVRERAARQEAGDLAIACPFKGLASFDVEDAAFFFGRERLVAEMAARLAGAPLLGVVGASGSGKSSAVRAGLVAGLAGGALPGSERWARVLLRPGEHPTATLEAATAAVAGEGRRLLVVDQFEECFTLCRDEAERAAFVAAIVAAAESDIAVVVAVRADYYARCAPYPALARLLAANHVLVGPLQRAELRRAIELPSERAGLRVEPELIDRLLADVELEPGALPLLSTALFELWERRD